MPQKSFIAALAGVALIALAGCESQSELETPAKPDEKDIAAAIGDDVERFYVPLEGDEPQQGPDDALVTIVELSDFQCPYCAKAATTLAQLEKRYGDDVRIVWMNNPLPFHAGAKPAANAALEAHAQKGDEAFWTMHDRLFANPRGISPESLAVTAADLGLDVDAVEKAVSGDKYAKTITKQQSMAKALNATGTPAFFINGRNLRGAQPITRFAMLIDDERRRANALIEAGVPRSELYETFVENGVRKVDPPPAPAAPAPDAGGVFNIPLPENPRAKGPADAKVVIQEFTDFECPVCGRVLPTLKRIEEEYGDQVRIVFRDYPLSFHPHAHLAAEAAREVFAQKGNEAFWKYHDMLLQNQRSLERADLELYAKLTGGIDMKRFKAALDSGKHRAAVDADIRAVAKAGARIGTPAFFINGKLSIQGRPPYETFKAAIDAELK